MEIKEKAWKRWKSKNKIESVKSMKTKEKAWARWRCNKVIKEKVIVIIKKEKQQQNNGKSNKKQQLDGRGYKRMQSKSLESKRYSESIVSGRLHQNSDLEVKKCGKTCKRGPAWSCDVNNT